MHVREESECTSRAKGLNTTQDGHVQQEPRNRSSVSRTRGHRMEFLPGSVSAGAGVGRFV